MRLNLTCSKGEMERHLNQGLRSYVRQVLAVFDETVRDYAADALLLSGGLDTSVIACLSSRYHKPRTVTVGFADGSAPDIYYARLVAQCFNLQNHVRLFTLEEAAQAAVYVVKTIKSFDSAEVRNDITIFIGMKHLREMGMSSVVTGDGGDELFAGYPFLFKHDHREITRWIRNVVKSWSFAAKPIGESVGLKVLQPFLDERIVELALSIPSEFKIVEYNGITYGKYVLRRAFENLVPTEVVWRAKDPIEVGSGSIELSRIFRVTSKEFAKLSKTVHLKDQEQAYYFKIYLETFGTMPKPKPGEKTCPICGAGVQVSRNHCKTCGAYPV